MILDFSKICNTYDKDFYTKEYFNATPCPKCPSIGRFNLHGSYRRHVFYIVDGCLYHELIEIKRIMCQSCESTHAVMPGDFIPYKLFSLFALLYILTACLIDRTPVLEVAEQNGLSYQFIYSCLYAFALYKNSIHLYFMEEMQPATPPGTDCGSVMGLIKKPYLKFQLGFTSRNRRPCFMCKFFNGGRGPFIGFMPPLKAAT